MKAIDILKSFLLLQNAVGVQEGDWDDLEFRERNDADNDGTVITIPSISIGFSFDKVGNFNGIYNYKE